MYDNQPHPLLAQVPLTVSPFVSLPTATTLPYTYKSLPSTLPLSSTEDRSRSQDFDRRKPKYIISSSGEAAHPNDIIAQCQALEAHLEQMQLKARTSLSEWEAKIKERELAEKRRVAPGWLDREEKILQPARTVGPASEQDTSLLDHAPLDPEHNHETKANTCHTEGEELDRAFGAMRMT